MLKNTRQIASLPSVKKTLGKGVFAECPKNNTRQTIWHSAKSRSPVVIWGFGNSLYVGVGSPFNFSAVMEPSLTAANGVTWLAPTTAFTSVLLFGPNMLFSGGKNCKNGEEDEEVRPRIGAFPNIKSHQNPLLASVNGHIGTQVTAEPVWTYVAVRGKFQ